MIPLDTIIQGDCLEEMKKLPDGCIDMILCDLPYGTTACKWDHVIPFEPLWKEYKRLIKDRGAIVLTASQPFTTHLIMSCIDLFKYEMIWEKSISSNFFNANKQPLKNHENILVFYKNQPVYNPQKEKRRYSYKDKRNGKSKQCSQYTDTPCTPQNNHGLFHPSSVLKIANPNNDNMHPTQKPVALFEYLIKTYTNEGDLVLDNCIGSGTTAVAAKRTGRHFIGIELSPEYCEIARKRVAAVPARLDRWAEADA